MLLHIHSPFLTVEIGLRQLGFHLKYSPEAQFQLGARLENLKDLFLDFSLSPALIADSAITQEAKV